MDYMQVNKHTTSGQLLMVNTQQAIIKFVSCFSSNQFVEFLVCARKLFNVCISNKNMSINVIKMFHKFS